MPGGHLCRSTGYCKPERASPGRRVSRRRKLSSSLPSFLSNPTFTEPSSPTVHRIRILDIGNSECLFERKCPASAPTVSPTECSWQLLRGNESIFGNSRRSLLRFPAIPQSISGCHPGGLQVWQQDGPHRCLSDCRTPLAAPYHYRGNDTVAITNPLSQTPSQLIDADPETKTSSLTGNALVVQDSSNPVAWRHTEKGVVDCIFGGRGAGHNDNV